MTFQEELVGIMERMITRRQFLVKLGEGLLSTMIALLTRPARVEAYHGYCHGYYKAKCCNLCCPPGYIQVLPHCSGTEVSSPAKWCWECAHSDGWVYRCCEAKDVGAQCNAACDKVYASWVQSTGDPAKPQEL